MTSKSNTVLVDGVTFELRPNLRHPTNPEWVCLRKSPKFVKRYEELAPEFSASNIVEVGVDQGGGTSYFAKLFQPKGLLAIELSDQPVETLTNFLAEHDKEGRVKVHWGVDQGDRVTVSGLADETFANQRLDMVVDDASHLYEPTKATFETLFPRLRQGGVYIIEDWSADHLVERRLAHEIATNPDGEIVQSLATAKPDTQKPLSLLICQLQVACARNPEWITSIRSFNNFCEIRRGVADIEPGTLMADYVGLIGQKMFENI